MAERDIFKSFLLKNAEYDIKTDMPIIESCNEIPNKIILFSEIFKTNDYNQWIAFYELDFKFFRVWNNPKKYLERIKKFNGVITCDFSLYRNMPLPMQENSILMSRMLANWWMQNGIKIIPNIRLGDERTYDSALSGLRNCSVIAFGTYGCSKTIEDKYYIKKGILEIIKRIKPHTIIIYGAMMPELKNILLIHNINYLQFENEYYKKLGEKNGIGRKI